MRDLARRALLSDEGLIPLYDFVSTSVIVPTRDEAENIVALLTRIEGCLDSAHEIVIVDDGTDDLPARVDIVRAELAAPVRVIRRLQAVGGLGGAVLDGVRCASGAVIVVCDGDLQHPPETIPGMIALLSDADVVVATRYIAGGSAGGLSSRARQMVSRSSGYVTKFLFPRKLAGCTDPMSGFFAFRRDALDLVAARPSGFKILLELLVRSPRVRIREIPFVFGPRFAGESHANVLEGVRFIRQVVKLRVRTSTRARFPEDVASTIVLPSAVVTRGLAEQGADT